ncbi:RES family NAD+ phosphorylase [Siccirubricoccus phaeus]|uniref:RES family NAD+ phosphorylase n=1 Tax=Siccirubricoccus phaeus TaxID=2595053 RepID=UPI0038B4B22D
MYAGGSFAVCLLAILVHANRRAPPSAARYVEALVPPNVSREIFQPELHAGWGNPLDVAVAQAFGKTWLQERRSALLIVPSVVTGGLDENAVVNPDHPDAARISVGPEMPVRLDPRLFGS